MVGVLTVLWEVLVPSAMGAEMRFYFVKLLNLFFLCKHYDIPCANKEKSQLFFKNKMKKKNKNQTKW